MVEPDRPQMAIRRMRSACWITKATNTRSNYVILIAFPLQQRLRERASMLRCTYVACLACKQCHRGKLFCSLPLFLALQNHNWKIYKDLFSTNNQRIMILTLDKYYDIFLHILVSVFFCLNHYITPKRTIRCISSWTAWPFKIGLINLMCICPCVFAYA